VTDRRGAHVLRHSLAVHLLRSGETLKGIGDLLGHRRPDTTFIYTNPQELHQAGEKPQVSWSVQAPNEFRSPMAGAR